MKANVTHGEFHSILGTIVGINAERIAVSGVVIGLKDSSDVMVIPVGNESDGPDYWQTIRLFAEGISQATLHAEQNGEPG